MRAKVFWEYLNSIEQQWVIKCKRYHLNEHWGCTPIKELTGQLNEEFKRVSTSAAKNYPVP
jgi:hypothetical protein